MKEHKNKKSGKTSFCIKIISQENHSWQGSIIWLEENKTMNFRSALELMKLIDSALPAEKKEFMFDVSQGDD